MLTAALGPMRTRARTVAWVFAVAALLRTFREPIRRALAPALPFKLANRHSEAIDAMAAAGALVMPSLESSGARAPPQAKSRANTTAPRRERTAASSPGRFPGQRHRLRERTAGRTHG